MSLPKLTKDIMTTDVLYCTEADSLAFAHDMLREKHIRHLPVVSSQNGDYIGLITQKVVLKQAFLAMSSGKEGGGLMPDVNVAQVMVNDVETIQPQLPLIDAGNYFVDSKHGCLPVVVNGKIEGIITSADFVKLAVTLLHGSE